MASPDPAQILRSILDASRFGVIARDSAGLVQMWSHGAERIFGWTEEEMLGRPADLALRLPNEPQGKVEISLPRKDGSFIAVEVWTGTWKGIARDAEGTLTIVLEIGGSTAEERKLASVEWELLLAMIQEEEIRAELRTERRFRELLEAAPDAIIEVDRDGRILLLNLATEKLFGYKRQELLGQPVEVLIPDALRAGHAQYRTAYREHPVARPMGIGLELHGQRKDGSRFPVEISLSPSTYEDEVRVTAVIRDVTDRKRLEETNREGERRFRLMIEGITDYAIFMLDTEGRIASWNIGAERIEQYTAEGIIGRHFSIFYPPEDREMKPGRALEIARATGKFAEEGWRVRKDGSRFWASVVIAAVHDQTGALVGFSKITRDLTERKQVEDELKAVREKYIGELELRNREVERANQLKSEFLASMSHELRTPLHTVIGFAELLAEQLEGPLNEKQQRFINYIHNDSLHLLALINDILDISKIESGRLELRRETFEIAAALEEALSSLRPQGIAKSIGIETKLFVPAPIFADRLRIKQILFNLLSNALKFTPEGGRIQIEAALRDGFLEMSVGDTGIGIPTEQHEAVFDKFYQVGATTKGVREGTGLGLAITKALVEEHGGRIWVESEPCRGSRFTFTIALEGMYEKGVGS